VAGTRSDAGELDHYFANGGVNVGAIMGPRSGGLADTDLDCPEAVALAPHFLPETHSIYGRAGKRRSHWLYTLDDPGPKATIQLKDEEQPMIVELRSGGGGKGSQSVWPGSIHKGTGELYEWDEDGERAGVSREQLMVSVAKIAVGTILLRHWPANGRHDAALAVGGFLARAGWKPDEIEHFVATICRMPNVSDEPDARGRDARDSAENFAKGERVFGLPQMIETFGDQPAKKIAKLVGYSDSAPMYVSPDAKDPDVERLNQDYALVIVGDKTAVMNTSAKNIQLLKVNAFETWFANKWVDRGGKLVALGKHWLTHPQRRQYDGLVFAPNREVPGCYNLWRGFAVEPRPGDCSKFKGPPAGQRVPRRSKALRLGVRLVGPDLPAP
jgi:Bifunctional DNA primase/polymerase, N-terminal